MLNLAIAILFLIPNVALGAMIFIDGRLGANCTSSNYSIANRTCTGKDGNAYNNIQSALAASAANDTIYFRSGSLTVNITGNDGIAVKNGQTWAQYPGDAPRSTTITADSSNRRVFTVYGGYGAHDVTIRDLTVVGGGCWGIHVASTNRAQIINNEVRGWNDQAINESGCAGIGITAYDTQNVVGGSITDNYVHSPVLANSDNAGIHFGGGAFTPSNVTVARNRVEGVRFGIWMDVEACQPARGATPCTIEENYVKSLHHCLHAEIGSTGTWRRNICDTPGRIGFLLRPGDSSEANSQTKVYNNTFYNFGTDNFGVGIWIQNDASSANVTNLEIKNNIIYRASGDVFYGITVGTLTIGQTTNRYQNNLLHMIGTTKGVCWGSPSVDTGGGCGSGRTFDDSASGMSSWASVAPSGVVSGNITGNPLFANPAGEDFRLCTGVGTPVASCTGKSPAIDAGANVGLPFQGTAPDLGAVESGASSGGVPPPPTIMSVTVTP